MNLACQVGLSQHSFTTLLTEPGLTVALLEGAGQIDPVWGIP